MSGPDPKFYERVDAHILLSNQQLAEGTPRMNVNGSTAFAAARFAAWTSASGFQNAEDMKKARQVSIDFFCQQYRVMIEDNLDEYIEHFAEYQARQP